MSITPEQIAPKVGDYIKVHLPGETPWAEVVAVASDTVVAVISNKLFREYSAEEKREWLGEKWGTAESLPELHKYKRGDKLRFHFVDGRWEVLCQQ